MGGGGGRGAGRVGGVRVNVIEELKFLGKLRKVFQQMLVVLRYLTKRN